MRALHILRAAIVYVNTLMVHDVLDETNATASLLSRTAVASPPWFGRSSCPTAR